MWLVGNDLTTNNSKTTPYHIYVYMLTLTWTERPSKEEMKKLYKNGCKGKSQMSIVTEKENLEEQLYIGQLSMGRWKLLSYSLIQKQVCLMSSALCDKMMY